MKENGTTFPNSPFSVQKIFLDLFPSLWYRDDHPRGFTECGHGGLQRRYLISCLLSLAALMSQYRGASPISRLQMPDDGS